MSDSSSVRLVEWNVNMALHAKTHALASLHPTIAVLPESAHPDRSGTALKAIGATSMQWTGGSLNKGLLVAAFGDWELRVDESFDPGYQWILPIHATGPHTIRLLTVWDMNHRGSGHDSARKLGSCRASMDRYATFLAGDSDLTIISGDFNNSVYWDKPGSSIKFGDFMDQLERQGFVSAYHHRTQCARGAEPDASLWWMKNVNKTYHVDYTFVDRPDAIASVTMGTSADWLPLSDHSPMTVDLAIPTHIKTTSAATRVDTSALPVTRTWTPHSHGERIDLECGLIPDMINGENGVNGIQKFRPTYATAKWNSGVLTEVRIWGPRILANGSLGTRELDHYWHSTRTAPEVRLDDLPATVAEILRARSAGR